VHLLSKEAYNPAAIEGQQQMKKATTRDSKRACTKASVLMVMADQLDCDLASARPPSPPQDPATSVSWHWSNGLAFPDHLQPTSGTTTQGTGLSRLVFKELIAYASKQMSSEHSKL
jgi:hypothetical protein